MGEHDETNPDRDAIMARRRRFIALALGGLATGCTSGKPGPDPTPVTTSESNGSTTTDQSESGTDTAPSPCLKVDLPPDRTKLDLPPEQESESDSGTETGTTGPRPCLAPIGMLLR
jgi:hypothetical protein